jgi:alpha-tubulin suppressor-like RCC1 family protein
MTTTLTVTARPRAMGPYRWLGALMLACAGFVLAGCDNALGAPKILQQPQDREAFVTQPATFAVAAEGASPLTFQWRKNGTDIPGATSPTYTTPATTVDDAGSRYSVVVSNGKGSASSNEASLTIRAAAAIVTQPSSLTVALGATATFTVVGSGDLLSYQWRRNDIDIAGATSATYTTPATIARDDGAVFTVAVRNPGGTAVSDPVVLTVSSAPAIVVAPVSQSVAAGRPAIFSALATGGELSYQWRRGSTNIDGETSPVYRLPNATLADDGAEFSVVVSNNLGTVTSVAATLTVQELATDPPPPLSANLAAGKSLTPTESFALARKQDGSLWSWGSNSVGQLGDGTTSAPRETPARVTLPNGATASAIAAGASHALALLADGSVYAWGLNNSGQLGVGDGLARALPTKVTLPAAAVAIAAGTIHSLVVLDDGRVFAWGDNTLGQLGNGARDPTPDPVEVPGISGAIAVAAGIGHSLALLGDGRVFAWGANESGQLGDGSFVLKRQPVDSGARNVARLRAGGSLSAAITTERVLLAWGNNSEGQLGLGAAVTSDIPTPTGIALGAVDAAPTSLHLLVAGSDGLVRAAGANASGQLGDGTTTARSVLTQATGLSEVQAVAAGGRTFSLAIVADGRIFAWGDNTAEQLANASLPATGTATPTAIPSFNTIP